MNKVKAWIKKIILLFPKGDVMLEMIAQRRRKITPPPSVDPKEVFTDYYQNNTWGNEESVSGAGSTITYTKKLRRELPSLWKQYEIKTFLDAPCGDYNWFQLIKKPLGLTYIGGDIVDELINRNQTRYGDQSTTFIPLDIIVNKLPSCDMWMCRDCLFHFSYENIYKTLANFLRSDVKYILTSVHTECEVNTDIVTGDARQLNLELPPFNLCKPIVYVDDWIPGYTVRRMGLWTKSMVAESLAKNPDVHTEIWQFADHYK